MTLLKTVLFYKGDFSMTQLDVCRSVWRLYLTQEETDFYGSILTEMLIQYTE